MTEDTKSKKTDEVEDEETRLRERLKAKQESRRRHQEENSEGKNPDRKDNDKNHHKHHGDNGKGPSSSVSSSSRDGRSSSEPGGAGDLSTQQKRRTRRRRRERRRQHREARREEFPPPPRFYHDYGPPGGPPPPGPPGPYGGGYRGGPDGPARWERNGPMPPPRGFHGPPYPPPHGGDWGPRGPPPPGWRGPMPPPHHRHPHHHHPRDEYGRQPRFRGRSRSVSSRSRSRTVSPSRSRSPESSVSRSRSPSRGSSPKRSRSDEEGDRRRQHKRRRRHHRHSRRERSPSSSSGSDSASASSQSSSESESEDKKQAEDEITNALTKDQRTVFVTQLVMRTTEKELRRFFKRTLNCKVKDVELLRDKRTGRHKGSAYVELARLEDVSRALQASGQVPDFQRFPILVKGSEAEKNYIIPASSATLTASMVLGSSAVDTSPLVGPNGKLLEAQKVYVGNLDPRVTQEHLFALFKQFGSLQKVNMQLDPETRQSRGFCFLSFRDPKEANLAIQTMTNQMLAGRPLKTGWASQASSIPGVEVVTSDEFPDDAATRIQNAHLVLSQLTGGTAGVATSVAAVTQMPAVMTTAEAAINAALGMPVDLSHALPSAVPTVAEARALATAQANFAATAAVVTSPIDDPTAIGNADKPTPHLLIRNMFDKDKETEPGWEEDIRLDFEEECTKYGKLCKVVVMSKEPGGKIYASFESVQGAQTCARNLAGRWFDKRQLRVAFIEKDEFPEPL